MNRNPSADVKLAEIKRRADNISHLNVSNPKNKYYRSVVDMKGNNGRTDGVTN